MTNYISNKHVLREGLQVVHRYKRHEDSRIGMFSDVLRVHGRQSCHKGTNQFLVLWLRSSGVGMLSVFSKWSKNFLLHS